MVIDAAKGIEEFVGSARKVVYNRRKTSIVQSPDREPRTFWHASELREPQAMP
jgi:hypothetical protein